MDLRKLKTLIDLVSDSNVSELEITEAEGKVRIVKGPVGAMVAAPIAAPVVAAAPIAAGQFGSQITSILLGVLSFTAASIFGYLINDWRDRESDRNHPVKKHRPFAAKKLNFVREGLANVTLEKLN